jgi:hypothetical protein
MKFTVEEMLAQLPLPANEKWKEGVWDLEPLKEKNVTLVFFSRAEPTIKPFTKKTNFISSPAAAACWSSKMSDLIAKTATLFSCLP